MVAKIRWGLGVIAVVLVSSTGFTRSFDVGPLIVGEVEYRADYWQDGPDSPLKASVRAIDVKTSAELWRVLLYEGISRRDTLPVVKNPKIASLTAFARGLIARTDDGATFFIDPATHKSEIVRDMRRDETTCKVHHRPLVEYLVPIHYGMVRGNPLTPEQRERYPQADSPIQGGCCVREEKSAILSRCPDCR